MSSAETLLRQGDLNGARAELVELVKKTPGNVEARMFLFQLLALAGEWTKARAQLNALAQLSPDAMMLSTAYGQAIEAEALRAEVFAGKAPVALLTKSQPWAADLAAALGHELAGRTDEAAEVRERAFAAAPDTPGTLDGVDFDWIADADSRFGPALEAIIAGKWGLITFDTLAYVRSEGAKDLRDMLWYPVQIGFRSGQSVAGFLPARYPGSELSDDVNDVLARSTRWVETDAGEIGLGVKGLGQHILNLSSGDERDLLSLRKLEFR